MSTTAAASRASSQARDRAITNDALIQLGKAGWVAKGVVYLLIGVLAVPIAFGGDEGSASKDGALSQVASNTWGTWLLWILALGLAGYAVWRFLTACMPASGGDDAETLVHRVAYLGSGIAYLVLAWTAGSIAASGGSSSSSGSGGSGSGGGEEATVERLSRSLIEQGWGRWVLALVGLGVLAYAAHQVREGVGRRFQEELDTSGASSTERTLLDRAGVAGHVGRGLVAALIAVFLLQAAWTADPDDANGLDASLREVAANGLGSLLVLLAALGLLAYGAFCVLSARHRILNGP
ncbi:hypothetical protein B7486_52980 [cyanobacterium TDX16]|nr:hypothetical protein B7486_52980 [cyanobacterium TDX16]